MKRFFILAAITLYYCIAPAQTFNYNTTLTWQALPKTHAFSPENKSASAIGILDDRSIEYKFEGKELFVFTRYHRIFRINDDKGIEIYNKVYIPVSDGALITDLQARTVLPGGKVITIAKEKIKQIEENGRLYQLFAMEGVEKGAEVEYTYTTKKQAVFFGMEVYEAGSVPFEKIAFSLVVPSHLKFDAKGFNGFKLSTDSVINEKRIIVGYDEKIPEPQEEKYALRGPHLKRVEYKLSYNLSSSNNVRMNTWKEFAKRAFELYTTIGAKDEKPLNAFVSQIKMDNGGSEEAKIMAIENYIKSTINVDRELLGEDVGSIERIVKSKSANHTGIFRIYAAAFQKTGINYQIVFAGRRDQFPLDEELENWNRIDETIFYFPASNKYLSPVTAELRYPYIPHYWAGTKGLFLKGTTIGSFKTAIGSFNEIMMEPYESHAINMEATVRFDATLDTVLIHSSQILKGYGATAYRPIYTFLPKEKQEEITNEIVKAVAKGAIISNIKVENSLLSDFNDNKPLSISADLKTTDMVEQAGNKLLLKIGEVIGQQTEMYQEKPRQLPIELEYPHVLARKISVEIPAGYVVKNLKDLNMNVVFKEGDEMTMGFVSTHKQVGNMVEIEVTESYKRLKYPLTEFENFVKVINAAADFNKVIMVLEKK